MDDFVRDVPAPRLGGGAHLKVSESENGDAGQDAVVDEELEGARLQIVQKECDHGIADHCRDHYAPHDRGERHVQLPRVLHLQELGEFLGGCAGDDRSRERE
jgi:hypothetical protein